MRKMLSTTISLTIDTCLVSAAGVGTAWTLSSIYAVYNDKSNRFPLIKDKVNYICIDGVVFGCILGFVLPPIIVVSTVANTVRLVKESVDYHD